MKLDNDFPVIKPDLQISFNYRLKELRSLYLLDALNIAVSKVSIKELDTELSKYVDEKYLKRLAGYHIRGEVFFPVPCLVKAYPYLLGYYRLLYGFSQKQFYGMSPFNSFSKLEEAGVVPDRVSPYVEKLCASLVGTGSILVENLDVISVDLASHLQLLTLGAQLRGSNNNTIGGGSTLDVVNLIRHITAKYIKSDINNTISLVNDKGELITIDFASDPDISINSKSSEFGAQRRPVLAIEIKGGRDVSNIHNRIGEAEKSHLKARNDGYKECWTLVRADVDLKVAVQESPTTDKFYFIDEIIKVGTDEYNKFRNDICPKLGIRCDE